MTPIFFNLLSNSFFSLLTGIVIVALFIWVFRVQTDSWKILLLSLPFAKIIYDLAMGVPRQSVLFSTVDPYSLPNGYQAFFIGGGFTGWSVFLNGVFNIRGLDGHTYYASVGDYLLIWIQNHLGPEFPSIIIAVLLTVSLVLITLRIRQAIKFEQVRMLDRINASPLGERQLGWRKIDIYESEGYSATPFTGGILKPYICIPTNAIKQLEPQELEAVIAHEVSHVRHFDLVTTVLIQFLGDIFWFVPGYRWLSRKIDRLREVVADQSAVKSGANPLSLASALIKLKEIPNNDSRYILYSAFFRERSLLKERIERLLGKKKEKAPRLGWRFVGVRVAVSVLLTGTVINSAFGGNHKTMFLRSPDWLLELLRALGI